MFPVERSHDISVTDPWTRNQELKALAALLIACAVILLPCLSYPLIEPDETRYAQIALEMNVSGDWITPRLDGHAYLDKPPLLYWLTACSFKWFGNNEIAARVPSTLAAFTMIFLTFFLGRRLVGARSAWLGSVLLLLCGGFVLAGRFLILDSLLSLFVIATLLTAYIAVREAPTHSSWWMVAGITCALGVLTKGPIALVLCIPPLVMSGWIRRDQSRVRIGQWLMFLLPVLVLCLPWYLAVWRANPEFGDYFFVEHNLKRFTEGSSHQQPFWFYLPVIFAGMFPTSLLLPALGMFLVSRTERDRGHRSKDLGFLCCAAMWILAFFSLASCKLPTYILPAIPLICLMLGEMFERTVLKPTLPSRVSQYLRPFPQRANLILCFTCLALAAVEIWLCTTISLAAAVVSTLALAAVISTVVCWNRPIAFSVSGWLATLVLAAILICFSSTCFLPLMATRRSTQATAAILARQDPEAWIVFVGQPPHAAELQLPQHRIAVFTARQQVELNAFIAEQENVIIVAAGRDIQLARNTVLGTHSVQAIHEHKHLFLATRIDARPKQLAAAKGPISR